jgi:hypothetical protein
MSIINPKELKKLMTSEVSLKEIEQCISILDRLVDNAHQILELPEDKRVALLKAAGTLSRPDRHEFKQRKKDSAKATKRKMIERDKHARKETGIRSAREATVFVAPKLLAAPSKEQLEERELESPRNCYVCKTVYTKLHHFYDTMCQDCGDFNYAKRFQTAELTGQVALVTGSRLKNRIPYCFNSFTLWSNSNCYYTFSSGCSLAFFKRRGFYAMGRSTKDPWSGLTSYPECGNFLQFHRTTIR